MKNSNNCWIGTKKSANQLKARPMDCREISKIIEDLSVKDQEIGFALDEEKFDEAIDLQVIVNELIFKARVGIIIEKTPRDEDEGYKLDIDHRDLVAKEFGYDSISSFYEGVTFTTKKENGKWNNKEELIDAYGNVLTSFEKVEQVFGFKNGVCWLSLWTDDGTILRFMMVDTKGKVLANVAQLDDDNLDNGIYAVCDYKDDDPNHQAEWHFIKSDGTRLSDQNYQEAAGFSGKVPRGWAKGDPSEPILIMPDGSERSIPAGVFGKELHFGSDCSWVRVGLEVYKIFSPVSNSFISPNQFDVRADYVLPFEGHWGGFKKGSWFYFINRDFKEIGPYKQIKQFAVSKDGKFSAAPVKQEDDKWCLIDGVGGHKLTRAEGYDEISVFSEELCWVKDGEEYFYLGLDGLEPKYLKGRRFKSSSPFIEGVASVQDFDGVRHEIDKFGRYVFE